MDDLIIMEDLWWKYQSSKDWILKDINFKVKKNEFVVIVGPSDAGKTTLCMCINGLIPHNITGTMKGDITILGMDTRKTNQDEFASNVGMVFQNPEDQFIGMSVSEDIVFGPENLAVPVDEIRRRLDWALKVVRMEGIPNKPPHELSGGQKQRVAIASALAMLPEILVLDEPTSELDPISKSEVFSVIDQLKREKDKTIILVEHLAEEYVQYADRIVLINEGKIELDCKPYEFFENEEKLKKIGVYPPLVTSFFNILKKNGEYHGKTPLTLEQAYATMKRIMMRKQ